MNKKMLIYFNSLQPSGGIERVIATLSEKLAENYQITILVKDEPISFYKLDERVKLLSLGNKLNFDMSSQLSRVFTAIKSVYKNTKSLKQYLSKNSFDYYYLAHPLNALEFQLARGINKKDTIITEHGAPDAYNTIYKSIKKWLYSKAKVYVVPTTTDTHYYNGLGFPAQYLPHFKSALPYEKAPLNQNIALSVGRFTAVKQQMVLLQIWNSLVNEKQIKNWKLFLVGNGELKNQFETYINTNNLQDFVFLMPPRQDVEFYYKQASLFLLSSKTEGFGMVLLEAISFGLPCISFDCPSGPRDIIKNNENGFLVTPNNEHALTQSIVKFITNPKLKNEMGAKSLEISNNWNDEKLLAQWNTILN
jgi:glycosyltransferase involved in cell wall biosynthesis